MYVGIDIGGTKTLLSVLNDSGEIVESHKFPTSEAYEDLLKGFSEGLKGFKNQTFQAGAVGVPGRVDREHGISLGSPHVQWKDVPLQADCQKIFGCPFVIDNDANLAALSEAMLHKDSDMVLYFTVSTGIGTGIIRGQQIEPALINSEGGHLMLPYNGKLTRWEDFASGHAIYQQFGKKAADITDPAIWKTVAHNLSLGFFEHIAILQPDLIVIGGSIGTYFDRYGDFLIEELKQYEIPIVQIPKIVGAERAEQAVIYGCYDLAKQIYGNG